MIRIKERWDNFRIWLNPRSEYLGVVGACIVLISWTISNTIYSRFTETRMTLDRVTTEIAQDQRIQTLRRGNREIKATLSRIDFMLSEAYPNSSFSVLKEHLRNSEERKNMFLQLTVADTHFFEHEDLAFQINSISRLTPSTNLPISLVNESVLALNSAELTLNDYNNARNKLEEKRKKSIELLRSGDLDNKLYREALKIFILEVVPLQIKSTEHREILRKLERTILSHITKEVNFLKTLNKFMEIFAWILYAFGVGVAIFGKWLEANKKYHAVSQEERA